MSHVTKSRYGDEQATEALTRGLAACPARLAPVLVRVIAMARAARASDFGALDAVRQHIDGELLMVTDDRSAAALWRARDAFRIPADVAHLDGYAEWVASRMLATDKRRTADSRAARLDAAAL